MNYPSAEDYIKAVQQPARVFTRPDLASSTFAVHPLLQIPVPASGTTAVVFKATVQGRAQALRFFTREDASTRQRYTALNTWFDERGLGGDVAACRWIDDAILVDGRRWPMVQMEWIEGSPLDQHVADLVETDDRPALGTLAQRWRDLVRRSQAARFAHGDLQHGNVLVDGEQRLRLVDFDSAWIAPFAGSAPPNEVGHRNYQPANRVWGPWMDTFPGLVIYLSLLALARDPDQWSRLNDGENLLFRHADYAPPHRTDAWGHVARLRDPVIDSLAERLRACCIPGWTATGGLESLLAAPSPWWTRSETAAVATVAVAGGPPRPSPTPRTPAPQAPSPHATTPQPQPQPQPQPRPLAAGAPWWSQTLPPVPPPAQPPPAEPKRRVGRALGTVGLAVLAWLVVAALLATSGRALGMAQDAAGVLGHTIGALAAVITVLVRVSRNRPS